MCKTRWIQGCWPWLSVHHGLGGPCICKCIISSLEAVAISLSGAFWQICRDQKESRQLCQQAWLSALGISNPGRRCLVYCIGVLDIACIRICSTFTSSLLSPFGTSAEQHHACCLIGITCECCFDSSLPMAIFTNPQHWSSHPGLCSCSNKNSAICILDELRMAVSRSQAGVITRGFAVCKFLELPCVTASLPKEPCGRVIFSCCHFAWVGILPDTHVLLTDMQLSWQPELGLISSSLDATIKITDVTKGVVWGTATVHSHGVSTFVYSNSFSVMASGGLDRDILLWEPSNLRRVGELVGHTAPITHLCLDSSASQVCPDVSCF